MVITYSRLGIIRDGCQFCSWTAEQGTNKSPLSPFAPENLVLRERLGRPVPHQPAHCPHPGLKYGAYSRGPLLPPAFHDGFHSKRQPPSGQSQAIGSGNHCVPMGVHCLESTGTGPVVLKVVRVTGAAFSGIITNPFLCASLFPDPLLEQWKCAIQEASEVNLWQTLGMM